MKRRTGMKRDVNSIGGSIGHATQLPTHAACQCLPYIRQDPYKPVFQAYSRASTLFDSTNSSQSENHFQNREHRREQRDSAHVAFPHQAELTTFPTSPGKTVRGSTTECVPCAVRDSSASST